MTTPTTPTAPPNAVAPPALAAKLAALRSTTVTLTPAEVEEAKVRKQIADEETRIAEERAAKRALENARILETCQERAGAKMGPLLELVDLEAAGVYVVGPAPVLMYEKFTDNLSKGNTNTSSDTRTLVLESLRYPDTKAKGTEIQATFDDFPAAPQSLCDAVLRVSGLKIKERKKG